MHIKKGIYVIYIIMLGMLNVFGCGSGKDGSDTSGPPSNTSGSPSNDNGSVTLSWKAPSVDANGSKLNDLSGHKIYYGMSSMNYTRAIDVGHFTSAVISNLSFGTWCFVVSAYDASGNESGYSNEMCKTI